MAAERSIIAIDQGTTSSRAVLFSEFGDLLEQTSLEYPQHFPKNGWVEHDPEDIWQSTVSVTADVISKARSMDRLPIAIGITNQRETALIWDRNNGKPIYNAIVWQDRRTSDICNELKNSGKESFVQKKTGLLLDPYFSATKFAWILDNVQGAREKALNGELCFGMSTAS